MKKVFIIVFIMSALLYFAEMSINKHDLPGQTTPSQIKQRVSPVSRQPRLWLESSEVSPNKLYLATSYTGDYEDRYHYYQIFITELATDRMYRIYTGDFRTMDWKWTNDNKIKISYNCGTGCLSIRIIDLNEHVSLESDRSGKWITKTFKSYQ